MSVSSNVTYIVDDSDSAIGYLCASTHQRVTNSYFHDTWTSIASTNCADGWFQYKFNGTKVYIFSPNTEYGQNYTVNMDSAGALIEYGNGIYTSGLLHDGEHTVIYAIGHEELHPAFDYLTVQAGSSTQMKGRTVIVDDYDPDITFSGNWSNVAFYPTKFDYSTGTYQSTAHWSNTAGDSLSFRFYGSSVAVYGIISNTTDTDGSIVISYSVDAEKATTSVSSANGTNQPIPMAQLFSVNVPDGLHTLVVNVTFVLNLRQIGIDFITYNASFESIDSMPSLSDSPVSTTSSSKTTNVGAIAGSVVGGVVFVTIFALFLYIFKKRTYQRRRTRAAAVVIGRNYNPHLDAKHQPIIEAYQMRDQKALP
ncbi:uncharacterized protein BT62DRAFT_935343 [Guyanagaster necrorhizus]|uniref:Transmembrane protein n=1 Tax=Guyanagaster necrorhizus TaxID=856835 RepID=A0A9P7VN88_9AGAR|nr:uncharacterized protein BT62DRAFT_935343 [Guyanagaster necrorhizus MCA 3950]KAG7443021.1 hypothetical protein BT62DRAFT_935343 [Guyanagaster necrorhizus MCA 3950]